MKRYLFVLAIILTPTSVLARIDYPDIPPPLFPFPEVPAFNPNQCFDDANNAHNQCIDALQPDIDYCDSLPTGSAKSLCYDQVWDSVLDCDDIYQAAIKDCMGVAEDTPEEDPTIDEPVEPIPDPCADDPNACPEETPSIEPIPDPCADDPNCIPEEQEPTPADEPTLADPVPEEYNNLEPTPAEHSILEPSSDI